jgi:hypothetical protein
MNALSKVAAQLTFQGKCQGTINGTEIFKAGMVELFEATYPLPHGEAHVMRATQRAPSPDYTTKIVNISFTKGTDDGTYGLFPDFYVVRVLFIDNSVQEQPRVYTQYQGNARVAYDAQNHIFSGEISVTLENLDDDDRKVVDLKVDFEAKKIVSAKRIPRRPSARSARSARC